MLQLMIYVGPVSYCSSSANDSADRRKLLKHHPDKRRSQGEEVKDESHDYFSCITIGKLCFLRPLTLIYRHVGLEIISTTIILFRLVLKFAVNIQIVLQLKEECSHPK